MPMTDVGLFSPVQLGPYQLANRIVMAPMTRCRAGEGRAPTPLAARYYAQRASAGLIVTEATVICPQGIGYGNTPGIYSQAQVEGWKQVTKAVHDAAGRIFLQLWHCGRISHPLWQENGEPPVSASAVAARGENYTPQGMKPFVAPRPLALEEIPAVIQHYRKGAKNARDAGFDGVEIHGANGYLPDQFLRDGTNRRADAYGGSVENRARFLLEATEAAIAVWGKNRVGVRLSPSGTFNDMQDSDPAKTFSFAVSALNRLGVAYVHLVEGTDADVRHGGTAVDTRVFRPLFERALIVCAGYDRKRADDVLSQGVADLVAFGTPFISNCDLPRRLKENLPLIAPDQTTFYAGGEKGYTDYPAYAL